MSNDARVRVRVAENRNTPIYILAGLSSDHDPQVRIGVGLNASTPRMIISHLVFDEDAEVRFWLASASYIPRRFLHELCQDPNPHVASRAKRTLVRLQPAASVQTVATFEFLTNDHFLLLRRLEKLIDNYSAWSTHQVLHELMSFLEELNRHFEWQQNFCFHDTSRFDRRLSALLEKNADTNHKIGDEISMLLNMQLDDSELVLGELLRLLALLITHSRFAERELFVGLRSRLKYEQIQEMNVRLGALLKIG